MAVVKEGIRLHLDAFLDGYRARMGSLTSEQLAGLCELLGMLERESIASDRQRAAFILAVAKRTTQDSFWPCEEPGRGVSKWYGTPVRIAYQEWRTYHSRGYFPLAGVRAYAKASLVVGRDLLESPDEMLRPRTAFQVMAHAAVYGWVSGHSLAEFIGAGVANYRDARRTFGITSDAAQVVTAAKAIEEVMRSAEAA